MKTGRSSSQAGLKEKTPMFPETANKATAKHVNTVMPDLIRHPLSAWIPAFAGMTYFGGFNRWSNNKELIVRYAIRLFAAAVVFMILTAGGVNAGTALKQKGFATSEDAVKALVAAMKSNDEKELLSIFGEAVKELISSGDPVSDAHRRQTFLDYYDRKNSMVPEGNQLVLVVGEKDWPFPIPLVKRGDQWFFDTMAGKEEILNRRIGENELSTVQTLLAVVDAQREYAMKDRDNDGVREYARKFGSDPGKKNGLYWPTNPGEEPSPLGELVADARAEGYQRSGAKQGPIPFHGYYFRILTQQGPQAPGGAFDYIVKKKMIGGFAVIAFPALYGNSGVMTFIVNHEGVIYQKDLGRNTAQVGKAMSEFDPDKTWKKVE
jgi:hypothetical protein